MPGTSYVPLQTKKNMEKTHAKFSMDQPFCQCSDWPWVFYSKTHLLQGQLAGPIRFQALLQSQCHDVRLLPSSQLKITQTPTIALSFNMLSWTFLNSNNLKTNGSWSALAIGTNTGNGSFPLWRTSIPTHHYKPPLKPHARWVWDLHASELLLDCLLLQPWLPRDVDNIICPKKHDRDISHDTYSGSAIPLGWMTTPNHWISLSQRSHWQRLNGLFSWCCQLSSSCLHPPTGPLLCPMAMLDPGSSAAQENMCKCTSSPSAYHNIFYWSDWLTDWPTEWMNEWMTEWRNEWLNEGMNERMKEQMADWIRTNVKQEFE